MPSETFPDVPNAQVGAMVQNYIETGAKKVTVTPNPDGTTCTVVVQT
jgi:hypothetical protein